jgi:isopenicillin N synthase-like dioxygenase
MASTTTNGASAQPPPTVTVSLTDLREGTIPLSTLEAAFGPDSLGIIIVTGLPPEFVTLRKRLLSLSSYLANLPENELAKLEKADANYAVGWSCGKETLADGRYDTLKGSYYAQPIHHPELEAKAKKLYPNLPEFTSENVWPSPEVLPDFEPVFERLCQLMVDVAGVVARECDRFGAERVEGYRKGVLEGIVRGSVCTKARLLHYFAPPESKEEDNGKVEDDWCATHKDLGALTGLTSQMFVDETLHPPQSNENGAFPDLPEMDNHPDPKAGLWIEDRSGRRTQAHIPRDALAFQTGEALEIITKGKFKAVPHFVRGGKGGEGRIARNTLAVFTQPNLWEVVDEEKGMDFAELGSFNLREKV